MPKRLNDIVHVYERTATDLESAQDELTVAVEHFRSKVEGAAKAHRAVANELLDYLRANPGEAVINNDHCYHLSDRHEIVRRPIHWAHHVWVEDPEPEPPARYVVPTDVNGEVKAAMSAVWDLGECGDAPITED